MCIRDSHGTDHRPENGRELTEATILRDADKMDAFGETGVARIIMAETRRNRTLYEIVSKWAPRISHKWDSITYLETKEAVEKDYLFAKDFFQTALNKLDKS
jgi:HD superfamily phosphodiesterase